MEALQNFERKNRKIKEQFKELIKNKPRLRESVIRFSWSNWGFGQEDLAASGKRLHKAGIKYIELHGNRYGKSLGYKVPKVKKVLNDYGLEISGVCGMFTPNNDLSSNEGWIRQEAIDYLKRNIELGYKLGAQYFLIVPAAVGRPEPIDDFEIDRSIETLSKVADEFQAAGLKGAIEPIRAAETSVVHTFQDAVNYINRLDHPAVQWINGDIYHMMQEEDHLGETIVNHGDKLINLHLADTNRRSLGEGMLNVDALIMALYLINYPQKRRFVTAEPLGSGGDPYPAMHGKPDPRKLDELVNQTFNYFRQREEIIKKTVNRGAN